MKLQFPSGDHTLAALLDAPEGPPRAWAIIAPCFTCSKNSKTSAWLGRALAAHGFASLRLDFKGLGESEGDFVKNSLTSNVADLVAAAAFLSARHAAPALLIGHSFGGTAVVRAAPRIASCRAVVTINSPSDPKHITSYFPDRLPEIHAAGHATIDIAGRPFPIGRDLLFDLEKDDPMTALANLGKPLLICHSPGDDVVAIEHAARAFQAAKHPKSFLSLDTADHLITHRPDVEYAASVIAAWSSRYLPG